MAIKRPKGKDGSVIVLEHSSALLKGNPLGDPHVRRLAVWLPPQYDAGRSRRFPMLMDLVGFRRLSELEGASHAAHDSGIFTE